MKPKFTLNNEACEFTPKACCRNSAHMLPVTDWLSDLPDEIEENDLVEVQFKNTRKVFFRNINHLPLEKGVSVIVEANPGYDLGEVVLTGQNPAGADPERRCVPAAGQLDRRRSDGGV